METMKTDLTSDSPCPKCGGVLKCYDRDVGGCREEDEYSLICAQCGLIDRHTIYDIENYSAADFESNPNRCPFCQGRPGTHPPTPKEYP